MLIKGTDLTDAQRRLVLSAFIYRWTSDNSRRKEAWAGIKGKPRIPLVTDAEWLRAYAFHFIADGSRLSAERHCEPVYMAD